MSDCGTRGWYYSDGREGPACTAPVGHAGGHLAVHHSLDDIPTGPKGNGTLSYALRYLLTEPRDALYHWRGTLLCRLGRHNPVCEGRHKFHDYR